MTGEVDDVARIRNPLHRARAIAARLDDLGAPGVTLWREHARYLKDHYPHLTKETHP